MTRPQLIHCPACGEDYAPTYRRCPFCNAKPPKEESPAEEYAEEDFLPGELDFDQDYDGSPRRSGGKRLPSRRRRSRRDPPWKVIAYILAALAVVVMVVIVVTKLLPKLSSPTADGSASPSSEIEAPFSEAPSEAPSESPAAPSEAPSEAPEVTSQLPTEAPGVTSETPDPFLELPDPTQPISSEVPAVSTSVPAAGVSLNYTDFTISAQYPDPVRLTVTGGTAAGWVSGDESVVTVSSSGLVTAVGNGNATVTCTLDSGAALTCTVRVSGFSAGSGSSGDNSAASSPAPSGSTEDSSATASPAPSGSSSASSTGQAKLNHVDFTIDSTYPDPVQLRVTGGTPSYWASKNDSVATVSQSGLVTAVSNGHTQVTCTLSDGAVLTCEVWVYIN